MQKPTALTTTPLAAQFPEVLAGGYTRIDGTVEFYGRVNALLEPHARVLDFGAGRGAWLEDECAYRRGLRSLAGKVAQLVACDIDPAVLENGEAHQKDVLVPGQRLPYENASFDMVLMDFVVEHLTNPAETFTEVSRILKPGGWLCCRTPNKNYYVSILGKLMPNRLQIKMAKAAQAGRKSADIFETAYLANSMAIFKKVLQAPKFSTYAYYYRPEPAYFFGRLWLLAILCTLEHHMPSFLSTNIFVFARKEF